MKDIGRVFANEWMKLMNRWRLWITVGLAVIMIGGLSGLYYIDQSRNGNQLEQQKQQITYMQQDLVKMKKDLQDKNYDAYGGSPQILQDQIKSTESMIQDATKQIKMDDDFLAGNWKPVLQAQIKEKQQVLTDGKWSKGEKGEGPQLSKQNIQELRAEINKIEAQLKQPDRPLLPWESSAYSAMKSMLMFTSIVFLPMLVVILVADMVSGEMTSGTIKLLFVRPVSRVKILVGKWLVSVVATIILLIGFYDTLFGVNIALFGTQGSQELEYVGVTYTFEMQSVDVGLGQTEMQKVPIPNYDQAELIPQWKLILMGSLFSIISMACVATVTFLCSCLFKSNMISTAVAFAVVVIGSIVTQMFNTGYLSWLFSLHFNLVRNWTGELSYQLGSNITLSYGITVLGCWTVISLIVGLVVLKRKDILNA